MTSLTIEKLSVEIHPDRAASGRAAGNAAAAVLRAALAEKGAARVIFAAAPSQDETLETLAAAPGIRWQDVTAFHMDEYIGLDTNAPQRFARYLEEHLFNKVSFGAINLITCGPGQSPQGVCDAYTQKLAAAPVDLVCLGIGENGHLAFNDPPADFNDPARVKVVTLDAACRQQQVNDGCFPSLDAVPRQAVTLTVPMLMSARCLVCTVPGPRKRDAVRNALHGPLSGDCPASILRTHANAALYVDAACYGY
ncbi:MAG: glucosamine-6-phosphate deaminase [Kiritimatiellaeota bacterium]|nr:glucosamine-6-phosphate deaminase [Kiritimatiellota bacterium]